MQGFGFKICGLGFIGLSLGLGASLLGLGVGIRPHRGHVSG